MEKGLALPKETIAFATKLLDQQFWCWGRDVSHPNQNALLTYGFRRHTSPPEKKQISHYVLTETTGPLLNPRVGRKIGLWGSGLFFSSSELGAIYIRRFTFAPTSMELNCPIETIGGPDEFPVPPPQRMLANPSPTALLMADVCLWIAHYEAWAQQLFGKKHREQCLKQWKKTVAATDEIVSQWGHLARAFQMIHSSPTE